MKFSILFLIAAMLFSNALAAQNRSGATAPKSSKLENKTVAMAKTKTKPKDKKMGLGSFNRPDEIENNTVGEALNAVESGNTEAAIDQLDDYAETDPDAAYGLGFAYFENGDVDKAVETFEQAVELDSSNIDAHFVLGLVYADEGEYGKAEEQFIQVLEIDPENADAWYELGFLYLNVELYEEATTCFNLVSLIDPDNADAPYELARLYAIQGDTEAALDQLELALQNGFSDLDLVSIDPDLDELRGTEKYGELKTEYNIPD